MAILLGLRVKFDADYIVKLIKIKKKLKSRRFSICIVKQKNPRLSRKMSRIFKDLFLKTGGCLPEYSWASHNSNGEHARHIHEISPSYMCVGSKNSVYTYYAG